MVRFRRWMPLVAVLLLAFNLRPVAVSVGPVLGDLSEDLSLSGSTAGLLTSLPALCFAVFGALAPGIARRWGQHRTVGVALLALVVGQVARAQVSSTILFLALTVLALAGMAMGNVLLPSLVRRHFPNRVGLATSLYSLSLSIGVTLASVGTVPLAIALGGWRAAFTAGAAIALAGLVCWVPMLRHNRVARTVVHGEVHHRLADVGRTRMGWAMALYFAIQSAQAYSVFGWLPTIYMDAGMDQLDAGLMLGIVTGLGIPTAFLVPVWVGRVAQPFGLLLLMEGFLILGFGGLLLAPMSVPWLWAVFLALGLSGFPFFLALVGTRARTPGGTAVLSGFSQSVGYFMAMFGPLGIGVLYDRFGDWTMALVLQLVLVVPMAVCGLLISRRWYIEDLITRPPHHSHGTPRTSSGKD